MAALIKSKLTEEMSGSRDWLVPWTEGKKFVSLKVEYQVPKILQNESRYFGDRTFLEPFFGRFNEKSEFVLSLSLALLFPSFLLRVGAVVRTKREKGQSQCGYYRTRCLSSLPICISILFLLSNFSLPSSSFLSLILLHHPSSLPPLSSHSLSLPYPLTHSLSLILSFTLFFSHLLRVQLKLR